MFSDNLNIIGNDYLKRIRCDNRGNNFTPLKIHEAMFTIKAYTRKELALLYFPNQSHGCATKYLKQLLVNSGEADELLRKLGLRRLLTKQEVTDIVKILGEP